MAYEFASLIRSDLSSLASEVQGLGHAAVAPATQFGNEGRQSDISFSQTMQDAFGKVNQDDQAAAQRMAAVDSGASDDLVGAMLASQEASLSFSMLMQVRNKVMGAVDELIKLPL